MRHGPAAAAGLLVLVLLGGTLPALAAVPRQVPTVAEIITTNGDEQVRFVDDPRVRRAEVEQALATGDGLTTGPYGSLAILFQDQTQIRVHRNSELLVKSVRAAAGAGETRLRLEKGAVWSRARSIPDSLKMETPSATAGIRGTDWRLDVDPATGRSTLIVLAGEVDFFNPFGSVTVARGEIAVADVGAPPTKTILLNPRDRPQWELVITPDFVRIVRVTGLTTGQLKAARARMRAAMPAAPAPAALLDLAEVEYELGEHAEARRLLAAATADPGAGDPAVTARIRLLSALLAAVDGRFDEADALAAQAAPGLDGRRRFIARLFRLQILAVRQRYAEAGRELEPLAREYPQYAEVALLRVLLTSFRGDQPRAIELATAGQARFPQDSWFPIWLAHLYLREDEPAKMKAAIDAALAMEPEQFLAWDALGTYHHFVAGPDPAAALAAYRRSIEIYPNYAPAWNNLALVHFDLGDYDAAREAILTAMRLAPHDLFYKVGYASLLLDVYDRLDEAEALLSEVLRREPTNPGALLVAGRLALRRGQPLAAVESMLKATVADPGLNRATTNLGVAYYEAGQFDAAAQAIDNALRLDPNDPIPPLVGSVMAQDQAQAGRAIRLGREALRRDERSRSQAVERIAKSQSGIVNAGSAYSNLGLDDWGRYYGQLLFDPAWATSHLFLATQYESVHARSAEAAQGLLLDPLAVSARNRYYDFVQQPFHDLTIGAGVGSEERAIRNAQSGTLQGFARLPLPVSYFVNFARVHSDGPRTNSATTDVSGLLAVGARLDERHQLLATLGGSESRRGVPGLVNAVDEDDRLTLSNVNGSLGYHYRAGPGNHVLARVLTSHTDQKFRNDRPLGIGLSDRSASLALAFGADTTRQLYAGGLCDATTLASAPRFLFGTLCTNSGRPFLASDLPAGLDGKRTAQEDIELTSGQLQVRHLFELGPVRLTYGAEWAPSRVEATVQATGLRPTTTGTIQVGGFVAPFPFGAAEGQSTRIALDRHAVRGYVDADAEPWRGLRLEGGLFVHHFDAGVGDDNTSLDPRAGVAWRAAPGHWLRAAGQRTQILPIQQTLAPVATVGLVARDDFTTDGASVTDYTLRWDAEWLPRLFTFVQADQQRISDFVVPVQFLPIERFQDAIRVDKGRIRSVSVGANAWLGERWGLVGRHRWTWTENLSKSPDRGQDLPLVPERTLDLGMTWIHPLQVRVSAFASYVGARPADTANTTDLHGYWTASAQVNWQPWDKRWSFTLTGTNLLDTEFDVARGIPGTGLSVFLTAEYRFGK